MASTTLTVLSQLPNVPYEVHRINLFSFTKDYCGTIVYVRIRPQDNQLDNDILSALLKYFPLSDEYIERCMTPNIPNFKLDIKNTCNFNISFEISDDYAINSLTSTFRASFNVPLKVYNYTPALQWNDIQFYAIPAANFDSKRICESIKKSLCLYDEFMELKLKQVAINHIFTNITNFVAKLFKKFK